MRARPNREQPGHDHDDAFAARDPRGAADAHDPRRAGGAGGCGEGCGCSHGADEAAGGADTSRAGGARGAEASNPGAEESNRGAEESVESRFEKLERDLADAQEQRLRLIAEYQTSQRRALECEARARGAGVADAARHFIPVIDHVDLALGQKAGMSAEKAIEGLAMLRAELAKALEKSGLDAIEPRPGDEFDPHRHEAVMRQPANGVASGHISVIFQPGYRLGDTVIRAAKVALAP